MREKQGHDTVWAAIRPIRSRTMKSQSAPSLHPRVLCAPICGVLLVLFAGISESAGPRAATKPITTAATPDLQAQVRATAAKVLPAIVSIASTVVVHDQAFSDEGLPFGMFKDVPPRRQYGQGSGVIVSPEGYIVTNHHVVAEAVDVEVILADRRQYKGRVVATDSKTDVAVVKISATGLPTAAGEIPVRWWSEILC